MVKHTDATTPSQFWLKAVSFKRASDCPARRSRRVFRHFISRYRVWRAPVKAALGRVSDYLR